MYFWWLVLVRPQIVSPLWSRFPALLQIRNPTLTPSTVTKRCNSVSLSVDAAVSQRCHSWAATVLSE